MLINWMGFNAAGFSVTRNVQQTYLLSGLPLRTYHDPVTTTTVSEMDYDPRGLPKSVAISTNAGIAFHPPVVETRNVAGLVTERSVNYATGPMSYAKSAWTYDILGRVTDQTVSRAPNAQTQVARQQLTYLGNDDVSTLITSFGTTAKRQDFTYDSRHQLLTATATPSSYFQGTYKYGPAGRFKQATVTQTAPPNPTEVKPRNVFYNYAGADPELVTSLTTGSVGGTPYVSYTYDLEGNQVTKTEAATGDSYAYTYDGSDRLRRATKKHNNVVTGSEEYWYDSSGSRSQVVKRSATGTVNEMVWYQGGTESHYTLSGSTSVLGHTFSHVSLGTPVARIDRSPDGTTATEYQFHGLAGSTLTAVSSTGTINATFNYAPYGELIESTNGGGPGAGTAVHNRRFNDKEQDVLTSLSYYGARYYDRILMGWTQVDPLYLRAPDLAALSTPRRSNLAAFSLNNPIRYFDPDGRDSQNGMSHWTDTFNDDRRGRVAASGDDETYSMAHRRYMDASVAHFMSGGNGAAGATGTTTANSCDGIHGVCDHQEMSPAEIQRLYRSLPDDLPSCASIELDGTAETLEAAGFFAYASGFAAVGMASGIAATALALTHAGSHDDIVVPLLLGAFTLGKSRVQTMTHYTSEGGLNGILGSNELRPSLGTTSPRDVKYGDGQYVSDIIPGTKTPSQLSKIFLNNPFNGRRFTHYLTLDVTGLNVKYGRPNVFVIPNQAPLNLTGRIRGHGRVP